MSTSLENRVTAAEQHIRDLEASRDALAADMQKRNLAARVAALESGAEQLGREIFVAARGLADRVSALETTVEMLRGLTGQGK